MHKVTVICNGGISALSAFANGKGAAVALDLPMEVMMEKEEKKRVRNLKTIALTFSYLNSIFKCGTDYRVRIRSKIPASNGLKSSSALTLSLVEGYLRINQIELDPETVIAHAARASIKNGTSVTGAYDDLSASFYGGMCIADNRNRKILERRTVSPVPVVVVADRNRRRSGDINLLDFKKLSRVSDSILRMLLQGFLYESMILNGYACGSITGLSQNLISEMYSMGASFSGQSGKGPAVFGVFGRMEDARAAAEKMESLGKTVRLTSFTNNGMVTHTENV